jgi:CO/xanthine dehydrogenase Mo-binding subunit
VPTVPAALNDRPDLPSKAAREASQPPTVAAIANAIAHATGKRLRDLPFDAERVKKALG